QNTPLHTTHWADLLETTAHTMRSQRRPPTYTESTSLSNPPSMPKSTAIHPNSEQSPILPQIEKLLTEQTSVILQAVDEKLSAQNKRIEEGFAAQDKRMEERFIAQEIRILAAVDKRLAKTEERFAKSLDELTKTIDKFLKRLTDIEEEFTFMKEDLKRVKAVLREKLGVSLD